MTIAKIGTAAAALLLSCSLAVAAPCNTGATKGKTPDQSAGANSSAADKSSKNEAGGQQPASPGTVGAMNNAGANQGVGQQAATDKSKEDPASKNTAGGNQPASPGTVGAMNNAGANQGVGKDDDC
ncbi:exopolysaccharide production protein YjbE [Methylobacterium haplocladii]|uniref:exopolysaccharide production protein YjbE n=1 Tax=Methylobacterium haplocladii TaxID=1176176 RepID=UPI001EE0AC93|nr:exopolysaccharide production protein YjbE [Methylobacterium haplocladii]GJD82355.1 hypothetical protein HPGCJGGD_0207 [Methylobacterium haplocladii]GLS61421.1 hypothetical protein GCM10007887_41300 [Methylobacterium haplocladii]